MHDAQSTRDRYFAVLGIILIMNLVLKIVYFTGLSQADDFSYGVYSYTLFRLEWPWSMDMDFRMLRFGLMFPAALVFMVLPPTEVTAVFFPFAISTGTVVMTYLIGRRLYGPNVGVAAAAILALFPADIIFGTMLLPDIVVPFFLAVALWCFLRAEDATGNAPKWWYAITGVMVFMAFISRENSYYFLLFFLPFAFNVNRWRRGLYLIGAGFAIPVVLLYTYYWFMTGDFLFNLHLAQHARDPLIESGYIPPNALNRFTQFLYMFPVFAGDHSRYISSMYGIIFYVGVPCLLYVILRAIAHKRYRELIVPWWFLAVYLFLEFGTLSFTDYQMMKKLPRFLLTLTPAMAIGYGVAITDALGIGTNKKLSSRLLFKNWISIATLAAVLALVMYFSFGALKYQNDSRDANMTQFRWGRDAIGKVSGVPVYATGGWWFNKLAFYLLPNLEYAEMNGRDAEMLRNLMDETDPQRLAGSIAIIDRKHFTGRNDLRIRHSYDDFGWYVLAPPDSWTLMDQRYDIEIYSIPTNWSPEPPEGPVLARSAAMHALDIGDPMLFLYMLHPESLQGMTQNSFLNFYNSLVRTSPENRKAIIYEQAEPRQFENKWKLILKNNTEVQ